MTRVDFYLLDSADAQARLQTVCKLIDKASSRGQRVFVHSDDTALLIRLDKSLLHYRPDRFIAHRLLVDHCNADASNSVNEACPEVVTLSSFAPTRHDAVLINLAREVPVFFSRFERTLEVIDRQESIREQGRTRYRFYQERGYPLKYHNL